MARSYQFAGLSVLTRPLAVNHAQEVQPAGMIRRRREDLLVRGFASSRWPC